MFNRELGEMPMKVYKKKIHRWKSKPKLWNDEIQNAGD